MWKGVEGSIIVQERGRKAKREGGEKGMGGEKWIDMGKGTSQGKKRWGWKGKEKWLKWEENGEEKKVKEERY